MTMIERVAKAIDGVQVWSRFNDWTSDRVEGLPIEICRYSADASTTDDIEVLKRFPASASMDDALRQTVSEMRARAALEAMRLPTEQMIKVGVDDSIFGPGVWGYRSWPDLVTERFRKMIDAALSGDA